MTRTRIIASLLMGTGIAGLLTAGQWIAEERHNGHLTTCRDQARWVMQETIADRMTPITATERLDGACEGVSPFERKTIVDTERSAALARESE